MGASWFLKHRDRCGVAFPHLLWAVAIAVPRKWSPSRCPEASRSANSRTIRKSSAAEQVANRSVMLRVSWRAGSAFAVLLCCGSINIHAARAQVSCPLAHNGKPLNDVGLFEGPPSDQAELMPEPGRFVVPQEPPVPWASLPNYTLGCFYDQARKDVVTVVLPRGVRVCDFEKGVQVVCH